MLLSGFLNENLAISKGHRLKRTQRTSPAASAAPAPAHAAPSHTAAGKKNVRAKSHASADGKGAPASVSAAGRRKHSADSSATSKRAKKIVVIVLGGIAAVLILVLVVGSAVSGCMSSLFSSSNSSSEEPYVSPYDFSCLTQENGRFVYTVDGTVKSLAGIDVSASDGTIDWEAVKADGIDFAMIRVGFRGWSAGDIHLDDNFESNFEQARAAGLQVGVYFFSQATTEAEAREEADFVLSQLDGASLDLPIVFDEEPIDGDEGRADNLSNAQCTKNAAAFCKKIAQAGYTPMIYCNRRDAARLDLSGALSSYQVWYAEYDATYPSGQFDFVMWQYATDGQVAGLQESGVDIDVLLDRDMLKRRACYGGRFAADVLCCEGLKRQRICTDMSTNGGIPWARLSRDSSYWASPSGAPSSSSPVSAGRVRQATRSSRSSSLRSSWRC